MSIKVKRRLDNLKIETSSEDRQEIDREIERRTKQWCDHGIDKTSDKELTEIVEQIRKKKKPREMGIYA